MKKFYMVDNFVSDPDRIRQSALDTGFGTWQPKNTVIGYKNYDGVNINGDHSTLVRSLVAVVGQPVYPASMIFRVTGASSDPSRVHSDRFFGQYSCIVYLSKEEDDSGTAFYKHRETGAIEQEALPTMLADQEKFNKIKADMDQGEGPLWERVHYVPAKYGRAVIFHAPLFHARVPKICSGTTPEDSRMVWVCHFNI